jgi:succinate dehydrogenase/fumarate reductase flavoprotein subunit
MVFGGCAGQAAAKAVKGKKPPAWRNEEAAQWLDVIARAKSRNTPAAKDRAPTHMLAELRELMWTKVGAFRTAEDLEFARDRIRTMRKHELDELAVPDEAVHNMSLVEWFELRNGLQAAEAVTVAGLNRRESRGAHQRLDFPDTLDGYQLNQQIALSGDEIVSSFAGMRQ